MRAEPVSGARLGAGPAPNHLLGGARREVPPPLRASDGGGVRGSGAWVPCGVRPHISRLLGCWPPSSVLASCSPFRVRNSVFPSPPGGPRDLEGIAPLTAFRVTPRPSSGRRARAGARPLSPAPRSRPSSRCPGGRRPLAPLLLSPPGRESAAHRPGTRRGAGAAPNRPRITSAPLSRFPESLFPLHSPQPLGEPRRDEVRVGGGEGGAPAKECAELGGGEPGSRFALPGGGRLAARAWIMCCLSRGGAERCQARGGRRLAGQEDRVLMAARKGREGGALCETCWPGKVQVARGPPFLVTRPHSSRDFSLYPTAPLHSPAKACTSALVLNPPSSSSATPFPAPLAARAAPLRVPISVPSLSWSGSGGQGCSS